MGEGALPLVSVMIATRDRAGLLQRALNSVFMQDYPDVEVLVVDDASEDGTSECVRENYPDVRLIRFEENRGYIIARNLMMGLAKGNYVVSLDDDAYLVNTDAITNVIRRMQAEPEIGMVAFQVQKPSGRRANGSRGEHYAHLFSGCGHCLRKSVFTEVGSYRELFFHQGEESDMALRLLDKGYRILFFPGAVVFHEMSPTGRDDARIPKYTIRNLLFRAWLNEPFPWWILSTGNTILKCVVKGARAGNLRHVLRGFRSAVGEIPRVMALRSPVSSKTVWLYLALRRAGINNASMVRQVYQAPPRSVRNLFA